ncbi:VWA domain-containing protein [Granulicella sp. 5B5]|uniref:VWA domain-containing protein n=1 Tax=Granulicella sp. 5B5 TaxID=1617967 RepID=UPI0015F4675C|nr:VWA domain-containing protein [Granulicella sp. 5B5]QMV18320.1 VWA domain-containing protein [Granulicella sp. 5B5]
MNPSHLARCLVALSIPATLLVAQQPYVLKLNTQEVALNFHAEDASGRTIPNLALADLRLRDNGKPPDKITLFTHSQNLPLRVAIVFDESASMAGYLSPRRVAQQLAATAIQSDKDQAMVVRFDFETQIQQPWTSDPAILIHAAAHVTDKNGTRLGGTAIWDTLYRVCRDHIPAQTPGAEVSANAILLFTDGDDNWSHARPQDVIDICTQRETPIYPFMLFGKEHFDKGQGLLRQLAEHTGGKVFYQQIGHTTMADSILQINQDLRDRYTLVYRPHALKLNSSFHTIKLDTPAKATQINVRDGYFAEP